MADIDLTFATAVGALVKGRAPVRSVPHPLSMPGNTALRDSAAARHVRVPVRLPASVSKWTLTVKNHNDTYRRNYGELTPLEAYIGRRAKNAAGEYTGDFAEAPTRIPLLSTQGTAGASARRYIWHGADYPLVANTEYLISFAYSKVSSEDAHMGIGGSYMGTDTANVAALTTSNAWSPNVPLDVYLTLDAPATVRTIAYTGSSSETGLKSPYPLRDSWGWRHAAMQGAFPVLLGASGALLEAWAGSNHYVWAKLAALFAPVDELVIAAGSNDVYAGRTLDQLEASLATTVTNARRVAIDIAFADIFPRRTEDASARVVREAYNAHLRTLPHGGLYVIRRATAVSTPEGLMRPELDSGDAIHLNAAGQAQLGEAAARGGTEVADLAARLAALEVNTGERNITSLLPAGSVISGALHLIRAGSTVWLDFRDLRLADPTADFHQWSGLLPSGFRPPRTTYMPLAEKATNTAGPVRVDAQGGVVVYAITGQKIMRGLVSFPTLNPAPTGTPPGVSA